MLFLKSCGIQTSIHYSPVHRFSYYRKKFGYKEKSLPNTENVAKRLVTLPLYPTMSMEDVSFVCDTVFDFFNGKGCCK